MHRPGQKLTTSLQQQHRVTSNSDTPWSSDKAERSQRSLATVDQLTQTADRSTGIYTTTTAAAAAPMSNADTARQQMLYIFTTTTAAAAAAAPMSTADTAIQQMLYTCYAVTQMLNFRPTSAYD